MNTPERSEFIPLNGKLAIELIEVNEDGNYNGSSIWRINKIAPNANLEHYKALKEGDFIIIGQYGWKMKPGHIIYINPGQILAIHPAP